MTHTPTSAVIEALLQDAKTHLYGEVTMVCSKFPSVEDFKAIYATDIREVHFFGGIDDPLAATLINNLSKDCPEQGFKIVQLLEGVQDGLQK